MLNTIAKPFGWLLLKFYEITGNYGIALILFAVAIRVILLPFTVKSRIGTMKSSLVQPQIKELEKRHGANSPKYAEEVRKLYKEEGIEPMSSCLWSLIQFPILIALYEAIRYPLTIMMGVPAELLEKGGAIAEKLTAMKFSTTMSTAYSQIAKAEFISDNFGAFKALSDKLVQIDFSFLGINLGNQPSYKFWTFFETDDFWPMLGLFLIPIITAIATYIQSAITLKTSGSAGDNESMRTTMMAMPIIMLFFCFSTPGAMGIYWIAGSVFTAIQEIILAKVFAKRYMKEFKEAEERAKLRKLKWENKKAETEEKRKLGTTEKNPNTSKKKIQQQEKLEKESKQADWEKEQGGKESGSGRVGNRPNARGRAYDPNRYNRDSAEKTEENTDEEVTGEE